MYRKKLIVSENNMHENRWQNCKENWISKWNIICVKIVALISFSCIIALILFKSFAISSNNSVHRNEIDFRITRGMTERKNECIFSLCNYWGGSRCCFDCSQIHVNDIIDQINSQYHQKNCSGAIKLTLEEVMFENSIMTKNWWNTNIPVAHIFIKACYLQDIEDGAFNQINFAATLTLTFSRSQISYYRKDMFTGLKNLADFELQDSQLAPSPNPMEDPKSEGIKFEFGVLQHFKDTLSTLQVQRSIKSPDAIKNLTGIHLGNLQIIDFRSNKQLAKIPDGVFNTNILEKLLLSECSLEHIHVNAFQNAPNVAIVYLDNNNLTTLNENTFSSLQRHDSITISKNNWNCSCELYFLTKYKQISDLQFTTCKNGTKMETIFDNCSSKPKTDLESTTSTETSSSTTVDQLKTCVTVSEQFSVSESDEQVKISYKGNLLSNEKITLLTSDDSACGLRGREGYINKTNTSYIMCKHDNQGNLDCFSGRSLPAFEDQTWLNNSEKLVAIIIAVVVVILGSLVTGLGVFYFMRKRPKHFTAFVRTPAEDVVILPPKPSTPVYLMPINKTPYTREVSYIPVRDPTYLTPISQRYNYDRPVLQRSLSDLSLKTVASYVTESQLLTAQTAKVLDSSGFDDPPPLPPPRNRYEEVIHKNDVQNRTIYKYW